MPSPELNRSTRLICEMAHALCSIWTIVYKDKNDLSASQSTAVRCLESASSTCNQLEQGRKSSICQATKSNHMVMRSSCFRTITPNSSFSTQALGSITTMLADVQEYLRSLIIPSTILLG